jgi:hypothetical protein
MEIINFLIGVSALALAIPPALQMFFGGPNVFIRPNTKDLPDAKGLQFYIATRRTHGILKKIGVSRQSTDITASFSLKEQGTGRVIIPMRRAYLSTQETEQPRLQVSLSTFWPAICTFVIFEDGKAYVLKDDHSEDLVLNRGQYIVELKVVFGHDQMCKWGGTFNVGTTRDELYWEP